MADHDVVRARAIVTEGEGIAQLVVPDDQVAHAVDDGEKRVNAVRVHWKAIRGVQAIHDLEVHARKADRLDRATLPVREIDQAQVAEDHGLLWRQADRAEDGHGRLADPCLVGVNDVVLLDGPQRLDHCAPVVDDDAGVIDDGAGLAVRWLGLEPEQPTEVDDRDDRPAQVADALAILRNLGGPGDLVKDHDLLNLLDPERVLLVVDLETDELR